MPVSVKICGLRTVRAAQTAVDNGADYLGFVHYPPSPRHITLEDLRPLLASLKNADSVAKVLVCVDPDNDTLQAIAQMPEITHVQLHGSESFKHVIAAKALTDKKIIKALRVAEAKDLEAVPSYAVCADALLFDAKPANATLPGGEGIAFDWSLLSGLQLEIPWFLAGGLNEENIERAAEQTGAALLDVSSGVESFRGVKDLTKIKQLLTKAQTL